jgi:hypothetical protein
MVAYRDRGFNTTYNFIVCVNITIAEWFCLGTIVLIVEGILGLHMPDLLGMFIVFGGFSLLFLNWLYFWWGGRYIRILQEFDLETVSRKPKCYVEGAVYFFLPMVVFFILLIVYEVSKK